MKIRSSILLTVIFSISCPSCMELDVNPISTITNASFWKTEDDVNGALNGMYVQFRNVTESIHLLGEARSEVFGPGVVGHGGFDIYYNNTLLPANAGPGWQNFYTVINSANLILKYTPDIAFKSESNKNKILAQAYTMRAFIYFVMTRSWGDLVIRSEPVESSNAEVTHKERSSQTDVFALIKSDLEEALKLFPDNNYSSGRCYWSKPAVNTLKADVYLWTGKRMNGGDVDFNQALQALNEVVNSGASLLPDFANIFSYDNKGNNEIIMCSRYQELEVGNNFYWRMWLIGSSVPENIDEETRNILHPIGGGQGIMVPSNNYRNQFSPDDTRKKGSIHEIFVDKDGQKEYYTCIVLKGSGLVKSGNRDFLNDVIYYRYADALLMLAEAKNALGQDPSPEINRVRERAYKDNFEKYRYENDTKEKNDEAILKERLLELSLEGGKRWWDLLRFDKAFDLVPSLQDKKGQDYYRLFPIGNSILSLEPKVKQNPGWDK